jgi:hypothetical protein
LPYDKVPDDVPFMKSTAKLGRDIHKQFKLQDVDGADFTREFRKFKDIRPDAIDFKNKIIYELKPYNIKSIKLGQKQLFRYQSYFDNGFELRLDVYFKD